MIDVQQAPEPVYTPTEAIVRIGVEVDKIIDHVVHSGDPEHIRWHFEAIAEIVGRVK